MNEKQELKKQVKQIIDKTSPFANNTRTINAMVKFVIEDRAKQKERD